MNFPGQISSSSTLRTLKIPGIGPMLGKRLSLLSFAPYPFARECFQDLC